MYAQGLERLLAVASFVLAKVELSESACNPVEENEEADKVAARGEWRRGCRCQKPRMEWGLRKWVRVGGGDADAED